MSWKLSTDINYGNDEKQHFFQPKALSVFVSLVAHITSLPPQPDLHRSDPWLPKYDPNSPCVLGSFLIHTRFAAYFKFVILLEQSCTFSPRVNSFVMDPISLFFWGGGAPHGVQCPSVLYTLRKFYSVPCSGLDSTQFQFTLYWDHG